MVEIGAGGGSIARVNKLEQIITGPDSAGSFPGPACYSNGGSMPTITDADLVIGKIDPNNFAGGKIKLSKQLADKAITENIVKFVNIDTNIAALAISEIVDETMSNAARVHTVEQGHETSNRTLIAFGGAAPLHIARVAEKLRVSKVIIPTNASVGSAVGFMGSDGKTMRITRKMKSQARTVVNITGGNLSAAADLLNISDDMLVAILLKRFRNDGPVVTKAALRKTKQTVRRLKSMCDMYDSLRPAAARRKAPMRRASSTTLIKN